jgi:thiamine-phosphate pyrophosphorylase
MVGLQSVVESCLAAEAGGITALQVRWKNASASELVSLTEDLVQALSIPVYVNDRADVAMAAGAVGVHLGADDLDPARVRSVAPQTFRIGASVGTEEEAERALAAEVDYWSIGSIYHTDTKRDAGAPIGTEGFRRLASFAPAGVPVIAIGGIDRTNVADVLRAGAIGVAVVNAVFGSKEIEKNARDLRTIIDDVLTPSHS